MGKQFDFDFVPFTTTQIRTMSINDLQRELQRFRRLIREASLQGLDTTPFETEYCYLDNEKQYRDSEKNR